MSVIASLCEGAYCSTLALVAQTNGTEKLEQRIGELNDRLNYFVSLFSSIGGWAAVAAALVSILIALFLGIAAFFGISGFRQLSRMRQDLSRNIARLEEESAKNQEQISHLSNQLSESNAGAIKNIEDRVSFYRYFLLGELSYNSSNFGGALRYFRKASEYPHSDSEVRYYIARCLTYRNELDEAVKILKQLNASSQKAPTILRALALAKRFSEPTEAQALLREAAACVDDSDRRLRAKIENEIGLIYRDLEDYQAARRHHLSALRLIEHDTVTQYFLGLAEILCGNKREGLRLIEISAQQATYESETQQLKEIWERVIAWSAAVAGKNYSDAKRLWPTVGPVVKSAYLRETINSHVMSICKGLTVERESVTDSIQKGGEDE